MTEQNTTLVQVFLNDSPAHFFGYEPDHEVREVFSYTTSSEGAPNAALHEAYTLLNVGDDPAFGPPDRRAKDYREPRNRSLSVGDVLCIDGQWFAVADVGFTSIAAPTQIATDETTLITKDLTDPRGRAALMARITYHGTQACIALTDSDGEEGELLIVETEKARETARKMLTKLTGNTNVAVVDWETARRMMAQLRQQETR